MYQSCEDKRPLTSFPCDSRTTSKYSFMQPIRDYMKPDAFSIDESPLTKSHQSTDQTTSYIGATMSNEYSTHWPLQKRRMRTVKKTACFRLSQGALTSGVPTLAKYKMHEYLCA